LWTAKWILVSEEANVIQAELEVPRLLGPVTSEREPIHLIAALATRRK
jgi:hypothetical protein